MKTLLFLTIAAGLVWAQPVAEVRQQIERLNAEMARAQAEMAQSKAASAARPALNLSKTLPVNRVAVRPLSSTSSDMWWRSEATARALNVTTAQEQRLEDVFQQYRLRLIDLNAGLEKEELVLEPLVAGDSFDESKVTAQIDRIAQARAELEKARGRMLLAIRKVLEPEQWRKLNLTSGRTR